MSREAMQAVLASLQLKAQAWESHRARMPGLVYSAKTGAADKLAPAFQKLLDTFVATSKERQETEEIGKAEGLLLSTLASGGGTDDYARKAEALRPFLKTRGGMTALASGVNAVADSEQRRLQATLSEAANKRAESAEKRAEAAEARAVESWTFEKHRRDVEFGQAVTLRDLDIAKGYKEIELLKKRMDNLPLKETAERKELEASIRASEVALAGQQILGSVPMEMTSVTMDTADRVFSGQLPRYVQEKLLGPGGEIETYFQLHPDQKGIEREVRADVGAWVTKMQATLVSQANQLVEVQERKRVRDQQHNQEVSASRGLRSGRVLMKKLLADYQLGATQGIQTSQGLLAMMTKQIDEEVERVYPVGGSYDPMEARVFAAAVEEVVQGTFGPIVDALQKKEFNEQTLRAGAQSLDYYTRLEEAARKSFTVKVDGENVNFPDMTLNTLEPVPPERIQAFMLYMQAHPELFGGVAPSKNVKGSRGPAPKISGTGVDPVNGVVPDALKGIEKKVNEVGSFR